MRTDLARILAYHAAGYNEPMAPDRMRWYEDALAGVSDEEAKEALQELARTSRFLPRPVDVLDLVRSKRRERAAKAALPEFVWTQEERAASELALAEIRNAAEALGLNGRS